MQSGLEVLLHPETVVILIPIPPRILSPNVMIATIRGRFAKAAATKKQRRLAMEAVQEERIETAPWNRIEVKPTFYFKTKRKHDDANAVASLKGAYDGIVEAGLVPDDTHEYWKNETPEFFVDRDNPRVILLIKRLA